MPAHALPAGPPRGPAQVHIGPAAAPAASVWQHSAGEGTDKQHCGALASAVCGFVLLLEYDQHSTLLLGSTASKKRQNVRR